MSSRVRVSLRHKNRLLCEATCSDPQKLDPLSLTFGGQVNKLRAAALFSFLYCDRPPSLRSSILSLAWHLQISPDALTVQEFPALLRRERSVVDRTSWLIYFFHTISPPFRKISETHALPLLGSLLFHPCATDTSRSKKFVRLA